MNPPGRRIVLYIAVSADGYIARPNGAIDWLPHPRGGEDYGWRDFRGSVDAAILGRKTYEGSLAMGASFTPEFPHYVFSRHPSQLPEAAGVQFLTELTPEFLRDLRAQSGKNTFLVGGAELISSFGCRRDRRIHHHHHPDIYWPRHPFVPRTSGHRSTNTSLVSKLLRRGCADALRFRWGWRRWVALELCTRSGEAVSDEPWVLRSSHRLRRGPEQH